MANDTVAALDGNDGNASGKWENQPGHRSLNSYNLPKWVKHPDVQKNVTYLKPADYMGSRRKQNFHGWNVAHVGAQCPSSDGQGFKMLGKATFEEINARDSVEGFTPLHYAVLCDNPKAVIWLLRNGADRNIPDFTGRKAEDMVEQHWGEFHQRYWEYVGPERKFVEDPSKVMTKRIKQMQEAFKGNDVENEFDAAGYRLIKAA